MEEVSKNWEEAFQQLNKDLFSADAVKGYRIDHILNEMTTPDSRILDYGCGMGRDVERLRNLGYKNAFGTDPSTKLLAHSSLYGEEIVRPMRGSKVPFDDSSFDLVYCSGVLHHIEWESLQSVFQEVYRLTDKAGKFLFIEPRNSFARKFGHTVVFSPLRWVVPQVNVLANCLKAEWPTYSVWLDREDEIVKMVESSGFRLVREERRLVTWLGVFEK